MASSDFWVGPQFWGGLETPD